MIDQISDTFKALGDPTRLRILLSLLEAEELCVHEIATAVTASESAVSHQLRILRQHHIVRATREGRSMRYRLDDEHIVTLLRQAIDHYQHSEVKHAVQH